MGMGYGANFTETTDEKTIKAFCPEEFKAFEQAIAESGVENIDEFALSIYNGDDGEDLETGQAYKILCDTFEKHTSLLLGLGYHDSTECGDRYDDIDGYYWWVDNVYEKTPRAKKLEEQGYTFQRKFYVTFG